MVTEGQFDLIRVEIGEEVAVVRVILGRRVCSPRLDVRRVMLFTCRKCNGALDVSWADQFDDLTVQ